MMQRECPVGAPMVDWFDHHDPEYPAKRFDWFEAIRATAGPVFWTPHWGGYWVVIGWEELTAAAKDWETFSSRPFGDREGDVVFNGHFIPSPDDLAEAPTVGSSMRETADDGGAGIRGLPLLSQDPPTWNDSRKLMAPLFSPTAIDAWR